MAATWKNDVAEARRLITAGANVNAVDDTVQSAFLIAASEGYLDLLNLTLQNGADVRSLDSYRGTALIRAAERGHAAVVGRLLRAGVAVDHVNRLGWTALLEAVLLGKGTPQYVDTVRLLIAAGADRDGVTLIQEADDQPAVMEALTTKRPDSPTAALLAGASSGDANLVAAALAAGRHPTPARSIPRLRRNRPNPPHGRRPLDPTGSPLSPYPASGQAQMAARVPSPRSSGGSG